MLEKSRESRGCFEVRQNIVTNIDREIYFTKCVGNFFSQSVLSLLQAQSLFDKGVMPYSGSFMEQPNKVIDAFRLIATHKADKMEKDRKAAEMRSRRGR